LFIFYYLIRWNVLLDPLLKIIRANFFKTRNQCLNLFLVIKKFLSKTTGHRNFFNLFKTLQTLSEIFLVKKNLSDNISHATYLVVSNNVQGYLEALVKLGLSIMKNQRIRWPCQHNVHISFTCLILVHQLMLCSETLFFFHFFFILFCF
jgi:hypothetical protein